MLCVVLPCLNFFLTDMTQVDNPRLLFLVPQEHKRIINKVHGLTNGKSFTFTKGNTTSNCNLDTELFFHDILKMVLKTKQIMR